MPFARLAIVAAVVLATAYAGIAFTKHGERIAVIWAANAFLVAILLRLPKATRLPYFLAGLCANIAADFVSGDTLGFAIALSCCNTFEVWVATLLWGKQGDGPPDLSRARELGVFALICGVIAPLTSATSATLVFVVLKGAPPLHVFRMWFISDALGMLTIAPLLLMVRRDDLIEITRLPHLKETMLVLLVVTVAALVIFIQRTFPVLFLVIPFLMVTAFRLQFVGAALATAIVAAIAVPLTEVDRGPLALMVNTTISDRILVLQAFLAVSVFTTLPLAAVLATRRRLEEEAVTARRAAEQANAAKSVFLHTMSHELRTPMTGIMGMCHLLLSNSQTPQQRQATEALQRSARTLLELLNDILDIAKIESGRMELEATSFRLSNVLKDVEELFAPAMEQKGLAFIIDTSAAPYDVLRGDARRLRQILFNLVSNALKFTERGSVTVRHRQSEQAGGVLTVLEVEDTGIGLSEGSQRRLFRAFEQEDSSISRRYGGTGLGLYISKQIADAMDGSIQVDSRPGEGSTFTVSLVLPRGIEAELAYSQTPTSNVDSAFLSDLHLSILVAEDNPTIQMLLTQITRASGHSVDVANNGEEAVNRAAGRAYDVILMDMQMPVMPGTEATRRIRAGGGPSAKVPIIALTADAILENRKLFLDAGCDAVVTKPIAWDLLAREVRVLVDRSRSGAPISGNAASNTSPDWPLSADVDYHALPIFDLSPVNELRASLGDGLLRSLLTDCVAAIDGYLNEVQQGAVMRDFQRVKRAAHDLKSTCAQFGAARASEIAHRIETEPETAPHMLIELTDAVIAGGKHLRDVGARLDAGQSPVSS